MRFYIIHCLPGSGLLRNSTPGQASLRVASQLYAGASFTPGCFATLRRGRLHSGLLRNSVQLPGSGLLRNSTPGQASLRVASQLYAGAGFTPGCSVALRSCPAPGCFATLRRGRLHSGVLRNSAQLPGSGLLRNSTPGQASLRLTPIYAPVGADGLPGRKKGNQISLVAFVKPGGAKETRTLDPHTASVML